MKFVIHLILFFSVLGIQAQDKIFPDDYCGSYEGELVIYNSKVEQRVPMEFHLQKTEDANTFSYRMIYDGQPNKVEKNYKLLVKDRVKGSYVIDENNGILLDANFLDNTLHSVFEVQNNLIVSTEQFYDDKMVFTIVFSNMAKRSSNEAVDDIPEVTSYPVSVVQKAILIKQ